MRFNERSPEHVEESDESTCSSVNSTHYQKDSIYSTKETVLTRNAKIQIFINNAFISILYFKHFYSILIIFILLFSALIFKSVLFEYTVKDNNVDIRHDSINLWLCCIALAFIVFVHLALSIILSGILRLIIYYIDKYNSYFHVASQMVGHISLNLVLTVVFVYAFSYKKTYGVSYSSINFAVDQWDVLFALGISNFLLSLVTLSVEFISFRFNRITFVKRIYYLFRLNYLLKLFKVIKLYSSRSATDNKKWESAFHWVKLKRNSITNDKIKKLPAMDYILPDEVQITEKSDYIYKEFQKSTESLIYRKSIHDYLPEEDIEDRVDKLYTFLSSQSIDTISDLEKYFDNKKKFETLLHNLQIHRDTEIKKYFIKFLINKQRNEKKNISRSIKQINGALRRIQFSFYSVILIFMTIYIFLSSYKKESMALSLVTAFFGTGFAFQSSVQNTIDSIIFLFFIHPFDVGDRVFITLDGHEENLIVSEMNVFSTSFIKFNGTVLYQSNSILSTKTITNIRRSGMMLEVHTMSVSADTKMGKLGMFKTGLARYIQENSRNFGPLAMVNIESIETSIKMNLKILVQYKRNWHDYLAYLYLKDKLMKELTRLLKVCEIEYVRPMQPIDLVKRRIKKTDISHSNVIGQKHV